MECQEILRFIMSSALLFFIKEPCLGKVKTRLASEIGHPEALRYYRLFVEHLWFKIQKLDCDVYVCFTPRHARLEIESWLKTRRCIAQEGKDLGERLYAAFQYVFNKGYARAVVMGSDSPDLPLDYIERALAVLSRRDVALGLCEDGGYYLLGLHATSLHSHLFYDIAWSTASVFEQTKQRIKEKGLSLEILPSWYDIDTLADLHRYLRQSKQ